MKDIFTHRYVRGKDRFHRPNVNTVNFGDRSLRSFGPIIWNQMLPEKLKSSNSLAIFKQSIKDWIPTNCTCVLCKDYVPGVGFVNITE